ncbi:MAG: beta-galactosidase, partial [Deltaproteobacteria bacterium]|nr:beta-galactosidase [Deltaproteobacteria bacterium]
MRVELDRYSLRISGVRQLIRAGSLHYFRLPSPALWRDRLEKMRQAGLNAVELCYPWNYHSETRGDYDFTGIRDVDCLHDMIEEAGLYLIARPGPYIGANIDLGGLPAWMLRDASLVPRCRLRERAAFSLEFMKAMREWFEQVVPRFATRS